MLSHHRSCCSGATSPNPALPAEEQSSGGTPGQDHVEAAQRLGVGDVVVGEGEGCAPLAVADAVGGGETGALPVAADHAWGGHAAADALGAPPADGWAAVALGVAAAEKGAL